MHSCLSEKLRQRLHAPPAHPPPDFQTNATCQKARREVAAEWRAAFDAGPAPEGYGRAVGVHVRVPEGGAALGHLERYANSLRDLLAGNNATVVVFGEHAGDAANVARLLGNNREIVVHEGRSPLDDLRAMVHVGILAVHGSSFSVLASVLRAGPAISEHRAPIHGRYAGNTYPATRGGGRRASGGTTARRGDSLEGRHAYIPSVTYTLARLDGSSALSPVTPTLGRFYTDTVSTGLLVCVR